MDEKQKYQSIDEINQERAKQEYQPQEEVKKDTAKEIEKSPLDQNPNVSFGTTDLEKMKAEQAKTETETPTENSEE